MLKCFCEKCFHEMANPAYCDNCQNVRVSSEPHDAQAGPTPGSYTSGIVNTVGAGVPVCINTAPDGRVLSIGDHVAGHFAASSAACSGTVGYAMLFEPTRSWLDRLKERFFPKNGGCRASG